MYYLILQSRGQTDGHVSRFLQEHRPSEFTQLLTDFRLSLCQVAMRWQCSRKRGKERKEEDVAEGRMDRSKEEGEMKEGKSEIDQGARGGGKEKMEGE